MSVFGQLRYFFLSGNSATAKELGAYLNNQDIRKRISDLRSQGWEIQSIRINKRGEKKYWLNPQQMEELRKSYNFSLEGDGKEK